MDKPIGIVNLSQHEQVLVNVQGEDIIKLDIYDMADGSAAFMDKAQAKALVSLLKSAIEEIEENEKQGVPWYKL